MVRCPRALSPHEPPTGRIGHLPYYYGLCPHRYGRFVHGRELFVHALAENSRPGADTRLKNAPYWNTDSAGRVCLGSMRVPGEVSVGSLPGWENAYFASEFTHPSGAVRLTTHSGGFLGLWSNLAGRKHFPV